MEQRHSWLKHCAGCLRDICTASCRHVPQNKTDTGKLLFLIIYWHPLSLVLLRLIYKTGHLSLSLLLQSYFAPGTVHFSSPYVTPQTGFILPTCIIQNKQQYKYKTSWQLSVKLFQYNPVNTPAIQQSTESTFCSQFKRKY